MRSRVPSTAARPPGFGRPPNKSQRTVSPRRVGNVRHVPPPPPWRCGARSTAASGLGAGRARPRSSIARGRSGGAARTSGGASGAGEAMGRRVGSAISARKNTARSLSDPRSAAFTDAAVPSWSIAMHNFDRGRAWGAPTSAVRHRSPSRCATFVASSAAPTTTVRSRAVDRAARSLGPTNAARSCRRSSPDGSKTRSACAGLVNVKRVVQATLSPLRVWRPTSRSCRASCPGVLACGTTAPVVRCHRAKRGSFRSSECATTIGLLMVLRRATRNPPPPPRRDETPHRRRAPRRSTTSMGRARKRDFPTRKKRRLRPSQFLDRLLQTCDGPLAHVPRLTRPLCASLLRLLLRLRALKFQRRLDLRDAAFVLR